MKTKNPAKRILKTAVIQMQSKPYALSENLQLVLNLAKEAHNKGANLIVLPELFDSGYCVNDKDAEFGIDLKAMEHGEKTLKNESLSALSGFAKSNKVHLVACSIEKTDKKLYDSAYIIPHQKAGSLENTARFICGAMKNRASKGVKNTRFLRWILGILVRKWVCKFAMKSALAWVQIF
ncbi:hypothetical protein VN0370_01430 [Helicobacter pylori]